MLLPSGRKFFSAWTAACALTAITAFSGVGREARAQVVQLPSTHTFGYSGAVTVPDSGQAYLGGVGGQRTGAASAGGGPLAGRSASSASSGTAVIASVSIIDLQAMDAAILNQPADIAASRPANYPLRNAGQPVINTLTPHLNARRMGADDLPPPNDPNAWQIALGGGAVSKVGPANRIVRDDTAVRYFMQRAKQASDVGRSAAALIYYRMAYERLTPEQRERLHAFQAKASAAAEGGEATATQAAATAASDAAATATTTEATLGSEPSASGAPASGEAASGEAASGEAATVPPADGANANPFDSPF